MSRLQDIFKDEANFDPEKDCASVNIYIAYLFYFISASIVFILYVLVLTCYQQKTVRKTGQWDSDCMVIENESVCRFLTKKASKTQLVKSFLAWKNCKKIPKCIKL